MALDKEEDRRDNYAMIANYAKPIFVKQITMPELTTTEAGRVVGVSREATRNWCNQNLVKARRVGLRGDYRIDMDDLRRFARQYGYQFDEELAQKLAR